MSMYPKKAVVTLLPEWKPLLEQLKEEQFHNNTQAATLSVGDWPP